jgi:methyl-accepting chemotaxis protein
MSIKHKVYSILAAFLVFAVASAALISFATIDQRRMVDDMSAVGERITGDVAELAKVTKEVQINIIQVQQWLTDISATRGLDGLDDGFDVASGQAEAFHQGSARGAELANRLGQPEIALAFEKVSEAFGPYYEMGQRMAQAYVDEGPSGGNRLMAEFDSKAEALGQTMESLIPLVDQMVQGGATRLRDGMAAILTEADRMTLLAIAIGVVGLVLAGAVAQVFTGSVARPIRLMTMAMGRLAEGDLEVEVPDQGRRDEVGAMAAAVQVFKSNAIDRERLAAAKRAEAEAKERRAERMEQLIEGFEAGVREVLAVVSSAASELTQTAHAMNSQATDCQTRTTAVASAVDRASERVRSVSASTEELSSSIREITGQVSASQDIAGQATADAARTNETMHGLEVAAQRIGEVMSLISGIADQTNLLALNATIEAARAGDAGRGFAVVANEVKTLASQSAKATEEIEAQVQSIQGASGEAAKAVKGIGGTIERMNEIAVSIAGAIEEQDAATREIARNMLDTSEDTEQVSANISKVNKATAEAETSAGNLLAASDELARNAESLKRSVEQFLAEIRAA